MHKVGGVPNAEQVLVSYHDAAWLPEGGRADVVLAGKHDTAPSPTCLVRLLVTQRRRVLVVRRLDGMGLDIPTLRVGEANVDECLQNLMVGALGGLHPITLLGYVRNHVPAAPDDYPWPWPHAHFTVWHSELPGDLHVGGVWLNAADAEAELGNRHWWPLADHVPR